MKKIILLFALLWGCLLTGCDDKLVAIQSEDNKTFDPAALFDTSPLSPEELFADLDAAVLDVTYDEGRELNAICNNRAAKGKLLRENEAGTLDESDNWVRYKVEVYEKAVVILINGNEYTFTNDRLRSIPEVIYAMPAQHLEGIWQPATMVPSDTSYEVRYTSLYNRSPTVEVRNIIEDDLE